LRRAASVNGVNRKLSSPAHDFLEQSCAGDESLRITGKIARFLKPS